MDINIHLFSCLISYSTSAALVGAGKGPPSSTARLKRTEACAYLLFATTVTLAAVHQQRSRRSLPPNEARHVSVWGNALTTSPLDLSSFVGDTRAATYLLIRRRSPPPNETRHYCVGKTP